MPARARFLVFALLLAARPALARDESRPSRPPVKGCAWEKASDAARGLEAWVQRCDFGFRKIDFLFEKNSLAIRYSDGGGKPDPVVDVFDLQPGDAPDGIQYFEAQPRSGALKVLFVRVGQDEPLFDEKTLRLLPAGQP